MINKNHKNKQFPKMLKQKTITHNIPTTAIKNAVLETMANLLEQERAQILALNKKDMDAYVGADRAMYDRLKVNDKKIDGMIASLHDVKNGADPTETVLFEHTREDGLRIVNKSVPFGNILIIYESRPDVTIEAASLAFKAGNKILLKGGKEARNSNKKLVEIWHQSLKAHNLSTDWITYLDFNREQTQAFLRQPDRPVDLIVPRGGERLIEYVKTHSSAPVIVSGRGNNFLYIHSEADFEKTLTVVLNAKTQKISACNALDKVLFDAKLPNLQARINQLIEQLQQEQVEILVDDKIGELTGLPTVKEEATWEEEFLAMKIVLGICEDTSDAIQKINQFSGGHSASIMTENSEAAALFMQAVDSAAVYHNASTRFTDGGQLGLGAELGISTEKLHQRGPLGLSALVTNKWFVFGDGHIRS